MVGHEGLLNGLIAHTNNYQADTTHRTARGSSVGAGTAPGADYMLDRNNIRPDSPGCGFGNIAVAVGVALRQPQR